MSTRPGTRPRAPRLRSPATIGFIAAVCLLASCLLAAGWHQAGPPDDWFAVALLSAFGFTSWLMREPQVRARVQLSFISIILLAAAVIVGPVGAGIVGFAAAVLKLDGARPIARVFNAAMFSGMGSIGGLVYLWVGGMDRIPATAGALDILVRVGLPLIVADVAQCLLNATLIAGILRVTSGSPLRAQVLQLLSTSGVAYIGYGVIGFLFVVLWIPAGVGWFSSLLVLAPLYVARWAFEQYGEEFRAHERTLRALVTAEEKKDPVNAGHSDKVAQLSEWIAEAMGMGHKEIQDVRTAGMLHDIGKVVVPASYLRSRRDLTDEDFVVIAGHAAAGVEMVRGIEFLAGSLDGIAHHHERYDGRGYPSGRRAEAIPLAARIVAAADTFDALTTSRPYREALGVADALGVLRARAGTHFDPAVVETLEKVVARHKWEPGDPLDASSGPQASALDHDEPEVSDRLAERPDLRAHIVGASEPAVPDDADDAEVVAPTRAEVSR